MRAIAAMAGVLLLLLTIPGGAFAKGDFGTNQVSNFGTLAPGPYTGYGDGFVGLSGPGTNDPIIGYLFRRDADAGFAVDHMDIFNSSATFTYPRGWAFGQFNGCAYAYKFDNFDLLNSTPSHADCQPYFNGMSKAALFCSSGDSLCSSTGFYEPPRTVSTTMACEAYGNVGSSLFGPNRTTATSVGQNKIGPVPQNTPVDIRYVTKNDQWVMGKISNFLFKAPGSSRAELAWFFLPRSCFTPTSSVPGAILDFEPFSSGSWSKIRNLGGGSFAMDGFAVSGLSTPAQVAVVDYDRDGKKDLLDFEPNTGGAWVKLHNNGNGTYSWADVAVSGLATPSAVVAMDYDRDSNVDLLDFEPNGQWVKLHNNGNGTFSWNGVAVSGMATPNAVVSMDYDHDGNLDVLDFEPNGQWVKLHNNGSGNLAWDGVAVGGMSIPSKAVAMDYNRDGNMDVLDFEPNGTWVKLRNLGNGSLSWDGVAVGGMSTPAQVAPIDYDGDGNMDLLDFEPSTNGSWVRLHNNGNGNFSNTGAAVSGLGTPTFAVTDTFVSH